MSILTILSAHLIHPIQTAPPPRQLCGCTNCKPGRPNKKEREIERRRKVKAFRSNTK